MLISAIKVVILPASASSCSGSSPMFVKEFSPWLASSVPLSSRGCTVSGAVPNASGVRSTISSVEEDDVDTESFEESGRDDDDACKAIVAVRCLDVE